MGTQIGKLLTECRQKIRYEDLKGKIIGIDANNLIYALLAPVRYQQTGGGYLTDSHGNVTSHLSGLFYRMTNLLPYGILPVLIFDGKPPQFKERELETRHQLKEKAELKRIDAMERGEFEEAAKYAQMTTRITSNMINDTKTLMKYFGIPVIHAASEAEAQGAFLVKQEKLDAIASQDYDSFLFGSPIVIRNLTVTRLRRAGKGDIELEPERVELSLLMKELQLKNQDQLIMLALLIGTDYNPGVKGIGPKTALRLVNKYETLESMINYLKTNYSSSEIDEAFTHPPEVLLNYFKEPEVETKIDFNHQQPHYSKIHEFLVEERDFNHERVSRQLKKMKANLQQKSQKSLDQFF